MNDDTFAIVRSRFLRCREARLSVESWNALQYVVWDSEFADNGYAATNRFGAGNFHIYRSVFRRSTHADVDLSATELFSLRWNVSIGSRRLLQASYSKNPSPVTLQGNRVLDPVDPVAIEVANFGPLVLLDNAIRTDPASPAPVVHVWQTHEGVRLLSTGNLFTRANPISVEAPRARSFVWADRTVAPGDIDGSAPPPPLPAPRFARPVFDVPPGSTEAAIQGAIDAAAALPGQRPVVHLAAGRYAVGRGRTVPAGADIQIVGDSLYRTVLAWSGAGRDTMLALAPPARATLRELALHGGGVADGIAVAEGLAPGAQVLVDQAYCNLAREHCVLAGPVDDTRVELRGSQLRNVSATDVRVVGSGGAVAVLGGATTAGWGSDMSSDRRVFDVVDGGRLLVQDVWYEGPNARLVRLDDRGTFTYWGGTLGPYASSPPAPIIEIAGFRGLVTLFGLRIDFCASCGPLDRPDRARRVIPRVILDPEAPETEALLIGLTGMHISDYVVPVGTLARSALTHALDYMPRRDPVAAPIPDLERAVDTVWLERMLAHSRGFRPADGPVTAAAAPPTDVRLHRVMTEDALVGLRISR